MIAATTTKPPNLKAKWLAPLASEDRKPKSTGSESARSKEEERCTSRGGRSDEGRQASLQTQLNYRAANGLLLTTSYTWSHNIDNTDGYLGFYAISPLYAYDQRVNKGNSSLDQRHVFAASMVYNLPFGRGQMFASHVNPAVDLAIGGWQLNTVVQAETGSPFSIIYPQYGGTYSVRADATSITPVPAWCPWTLHLRHFCSPAAGA